MCHAAVAQLVRALACHARGCGFEPRQLRKMESLPKFKERGESELEKVKGLKESIIHLCREMKENIERGYDALVSDDTGGRIPTLILRAVCQQVHNNPDLKTVFIASGSHYKPKNPEENRLLDEYIESGIGNSKRVLLITQHIQHGGTINHLIEHINSAGATLVDVATVDNFEGQLLNPKVGGNLYVGGILNKDQIGFTENNNMASGISKRGEYDPRPIRLDTALNNGDQKRSTYLSFDEYDEFAGIEKYDGFYEKRDKREKAAQRLEELDSVPLSENEKRDIQENINRTRIAIRQLASEIVQEVWQK